MTRVLLKQVAKKVLSSVDEILWALRHRFDPRHRYNILKTGLPPGYYDPDQQILYAVMTAFAQWAETNHALDSEIILAENTGFEDPETAKYYQERKESFDDFREAYHMWLRYGRDPQKYREEVCFARRENGTLDYNFDLDQEIKKESARMVCLVAKHLTHLWY